MTVLIVLVIILLIAVLALAALTLSLRRELQQTTEQLSRLQTNTNQPANTNIEAKLSELNQRLVENNEKDDREFNTLWAEFENLRKELLTEIEQLRDPARWQSLLAERIPDYRELRGQLQQLLQAQPELAGQLRANLPAYLIDDHWLPGLLDFARWPYDRINWLEVLILPVGSKLDGQGQHNDQLVGPFNALIGTLGYQVIQPPNGEIYRPDQHEVVEQRLSSSPRGTILGTRARGYAQQGAILRKAKVIISAGQS